jgi:pectin methylesterase-like acyl-CoA thioesterase
MRKLTLLFLLFAIVFPMGKLYSQTAVTATWNLYMNSSKVYDLTGSTSPSGNITAANASWNTSYLSSTGYGTTSAGSSYGLMLSFSNAIISKTITTASNANIYEEFAVTPNTGKKLNASSIALYVGAQGGNGIRENVCISTDGFTTSTQLNTATISATGTSMSLVSLTIPSSVSVSAGQTLRARVYFWYNANTMTVTGKYPLTQGVNLKGTATDATVPVVTTSTISGVATTSASCGGTVSDNGGADVTARGVCWSTSLNPKITDSYTTDGTGTGSFTSSLTGLGSGVTYHIRAYATNSVGTGYGADSTFTTLAGMSLPTISTSAISNITVSSAAGGGNATSDGGATITAKGICYSRWGTPTIDSSHTSDGSGTGSFTSSLTGLTGGTTYYVRAYATNSVGTAYGDQVSFGTPITYYNKVDSDISQVSNWGTSSDGSGTSPVDFSGMNATYNVINAGATFGSALTISATGSKIVVGDGTNAVSLTIPSAYPYTGSIDAANNATLNLQTTTGLTLGTLNAGSTVNYDGSNSLTILAANYGNLGSTNDAGASRTLSTSGTIFVAGSFSAGSATYTVASSTVTLNGASAQTVNGGTFYNLNVNNSASVPNGYTLTLTSGGTLAIPSSKTLTVNGILDNKSANAVTLSGSLVISSGAEYWADVSGSKLPTATYNAGSTLRILNSLDGSLGYQINVGGNVVINYAGSLGAWTKGSNATYTIGGDFTLTNGIFNNGNGGSARTVVVNGNAYIDGGEYDIAGSSANSTTQTFTVKGNLVMTGGTLYASNNTTSGTAATINIGGNLVHTGGVLGNGVSAVGGKIVFNGSAAQSISTTGFSNGPTLVLNNTASGIGVTLGSNVTIDNTLTLTSGILALASYNLTFGADATNSGSSASSFIYPNGSGQLRKTVSTPISGYTFPVGDYISTAEYAPVSLNVSADAYSSAYVYLTTTRSKHPNNSSAADYLNRYWTVNGSGFTNPVYSGTFTYPAADVQGTESIIYGAFYTGSGWLNVGNVSISNHNFTTPNLDKFGDFTCADGSVVPTSPIITTSATGIYFGRVDMETTSSERTFSVTGYYLSPAADNITVTAPSHFEVSLTSGSGFASSVQVPYTGSNLSTTTVYVHFVAPTVSAATMYSGTLTVSGGGAASQNVSLSGKSTVPNSALGANLVVALDGSGDYTTIQAAVNAIPSSHTGISPYVVFIRQGWYYEKVTIPSSVSDVKFIGEERDSTILDYDDYVGKNGLGTSTCQTLQINSSNVTFQNMTIQDTVTVERAVAVNIGSAVDKVKFLDCNLYGHQDTYYLWNCYRVYHKNCKITGSVDFIFGNGIAVFDSCQIVVNRNGGVITAAGTGSNLKYGIVFRHCTLASDSIGFDGSPVGTFYLGRPWQNNPRTVYLECFEPATLNADGWTTMSVSPTLYAEYDCSGPGVSATRANGGTIMSKSDAVSYYYLSSIFDASSKTDSPFADSWIPLSDSALVLLPVELTTFSATANLHTVTLSWKTATEVNSARFEVERAQSNASASSALVWEKVGSVNASGYSNSPKQYSFTEEVKQIGSFKYRLKTIDNDGTYQYSSTVDVTISTPQKFSVSQNYPNPFNPSTVIAFSIAADSHVVLELFSVSGQKIATLINENRAANTYDYELNMNKYNLPSGIYFYRLSGTDIATGKAQVATKKLAYIR